MYNKFKTKKSSRNPYLKVVLAAFAFVNCQSRDYTNVEIALADAYYAGTVVYPDKFKDINIEQKTDEIFEFLLGEKLYSKYVAAGQGFGSLTIGK